MESEVLEAMSLSVPECEGIFLTNEHDCYTEGS